MAGKLKLGYDKNGELWSWRDGKKVSRVGGIEYNTPKKTTKKKTTTRKKK